MTASEPPVASAAVPPADPTARRAATRNGAAVVRALLDIGPPPWRRLALATALGVAGAAATVGLLAGSGYVVGRAAFRPGLGAIAGLLAGVEVLAFLRGPLRYGERLAAHDAAFRSLSRWRVWLYDRLEPLAPAALRGWRSGDLLARMTDDVDALQDLYLRCLLPVAVTAAAATLAVVLVAVILPLAGAVLGASLLVALVAAPATAIVTGTARGSESELRGRLSAEVVDLLHAAPELLAFGREHEALAILEETDAELTAIARRRAWSAGLSAAIVTICIGAAVVGVLAAGVAAVRSHQMGPVMLAVLPLAAIGAFETVPAVAAAAARAADVVAAGRRLLQLGDVAVPVADPAHPEPLPEGTPSLALAGARLRYAPDLGFALDGMDLSVGPGELVGLVGPSGSGKSSVVNVLLRFWPLHGGRATLGGIDLDGLAQREVRRAVALVDQDAHLFAGTIRQNVALGRPRASDEEILAALERAQLAEWVASLPAGIATQVGDEGAQVSSGQRRRIALARALLMDAPVLVLDEPTVGVDAESGERLLGGVVDDARRRGASVLLLTHRSEELEHLDRVVAMENGRSTEVTPPGHPGAAVTR